MSIEIQLFRAMARIVAGWPEQDSPCKRPNTFAVLNDLSDLNADNLLKTSPRYKDLGILFSRGFQRQGFSVPSFKSEYPIIALVQDEVTTTLSKGVSEYAFSLAVFDQNSYPDSQSGAYEENRTLEEQASDMFGILFAFLAELDDAQIYDASGTPIVAFPGDSPPVEASFMMDVRVVNAFSARYIRDYGVDNVSGVFTQIRITLPKCAFSGPSENFDYTVELPSNYLPDNCEGC